MEVNVLSEIIRALGHMLAVWAVVAQLFVHTLDVAK